MVPHVKTRKHYVKGHYYGYPFLSSRGNFKNEINKKNGKKKDDVIERHLKNLGVFSVCN